MAVSVFIPHPIFVPNKPSRESFFFGPKGSWWAKKSLIMLKFILKSGQSLSGRVDEWTSLWVYEFMSLWVYEFMSLWVDKLMSWQVDELTSWRVAEWNSKQVDELTSGLAEALTSGLFTTLTTSLVDKWARKQVVDEGRWLFIVKQKWIWKVIGAS